MLVTFDRWSCETFYHEGLDRFHCFRRSEDSAGAAAHSLPETPSPTDAHGCRRPAQIADEDASRNAGHDAAARDDATDRPRDRWHLRVRLRRLPRYDRRRDIPGRGGRRAQRMNHVETVPSKRICLRKARARYSPRRFAAQIKLSDAERAKNERFARVMSGGMRDYEGWEEVRAFKTVRKSNAGASPRHRREACSTAYLRTGSRPSSSPTSKKTTTSSRLG